MQCARIWLIALLSAAYANAAVVKTPRSTKEPWEFSEALTSSYLIRSFNGTWITDEEFYYTSADYSIHTYNARTKTDTVFVPSELFEAYGSGATFTVSPDNEKILVRYDVEELFRHSRIARYDVVDINTRATIKVRDGEKLQYCVWSPMTGRLSYVFNNNVYIHFDENDERNLTEDGIVNIVYNGIADWVYEEEVLSSSNAIWWAPDGLKLAVGFFNDTNVKTFNYHLYGESDAVDNQYPKDVNLKYPKTGTPNPEVALKIFDLSKESLTTVKVTAPVEIVTHDHILQNVAWTSNETLLLTWLNRRQNISSIQHCTIEGVCDEVKRIEEPDGWISMSTPICLKTATNCLFTYWINDWLQVWNLDLTTGNNVWHSRGNFTVLDIYGYDEANNDLYYQATLESNASVYQVFKNDECLTCNLRDIEGAYCLSASARFSKSFSYYAVICSGPNPRYTKIFETKTNTEVETWVLNSEFREKWETKLRSTIKFRNVTLADGSIALAKIELPPNLDETKKYPMIVRVYGGPNSVRVTNSFEISFKDYLITHYDVIYVAIDGRGTGNKGKKLLFSVNNNLGEHEVEDQIFVTKSLQKEFFFIDNERIGIWGWSYGGYVTAKTIAYDTYRVFQCGISVAPVTSWLYYDTIYTERYMGLPEDNLDKYSSSSVFKDIENFRKHDFLLIHGSGDDNVHYQQSLMLAKVLQSNDIAFEEMTYTDENHSIPTFQTHLYHTMEHFWANCLNFDVDDVN